MDPKTFKIVSFALPVKDTRSTSKGLSINRDTLLNLLRNRRTEVMVFIMALMLIILIMLMMITIEGIKRTLTVSVEAMLSVMWLSSEVWVQLGVENRLALIQLVTVFRK